MKRLKINIAGIVQGVGFRPFIYNLAHRFALGGYILNNAAGVEIEVEGQADKLDAFIQAITREAPPLAVLAEVSIASLAVCGDREFVIKNSTGAIVKTALVSPDVATCGDCQREMADYTDRRYHYPFINCTNCGPRYSIIQEVPYDRPATTMADFMMCSDCRVEYNDPNNRRFHAQPNACHDCGPVYQLFDHTGRPFPDDTEQFTMTKQLVADGAIIAIKGIGGYHLACDARNEQAVKQLRSRKIREDKPFAVMGGSLAAVRHLCFVSEAEQAMLSGSIRPIVLLTKRPEYDLASHVAPRNPWLGVMLPYAPIHWLLLAADDVWVMTSGNTSDEPIAYDDQDALERLKGIADYFLVHNRPIYQRVDDSVVREVRGQSYPLRRSRGFVPAPILLSSAIPSILATGGELKNTFCLTRGKQAFLSPHVGDLENAATYNSYIDLIHHFEKLFDIRPEMVAYDLHPEYLATKYAQTLALPKVGVQHHHAHIAAVMAEHGLAEKVIGVAFDGTGYGPDGALWGGEFLVADYANYVRAGHLRYLRLPGGAKAIQEPWRLALWMLFELYGKDLANLAIPFVRNLPASWELITTAAAQGLNAPLASGAGRLFDAVSALLNLCQCINYEGQAAVELELSAVGQTAQLLPYDLSDSKPRCLDFRPTFAELVNQLQKGVNPALLAAAFHRTMVTATVDMVRHISRDTGITKVALSGGVWQNSTLLIQTLSLLEKSGFTYYIHRQVPPNDGGLALGQAVIAGHRFR
ncbi:Carbamoyltransferase HypF [bioreactor metagenome]|uniref:Carbamoyl phosphate-converting enzyme HypF n=1 Tax=bioreactor metagenome TaxID=1076179 RepID=A0A644TLQ8_9ZZZZ|nr:carbamoyltransferase HypF [Negativicutes bacterium]